MYLYSFFAVILLLSTSIEGNSSVAIERVRKGLIRSNVFKRPFQSLFRSCSRFTVSLPVCWRFVVECLVSVLEGILMNGVWREQFGKVRLVWIGAKCRLSCIQRRRRPAVKECLYRAPKHEGRRIFNVMVSALNFYSLDSSIQSQGSSIDSFG